MKAPVKLPVWLTDDSVLVAADNKMIDILNAATDLEQEFIVHAVNHHQILIDMVNDAIHHPLNKAPRGGLSPEQEHLLANLKVI